MSVAACAAGPRAEAPPAPAPRSFVETIPGTTLAFEVVETPGGPWFATTEVTWDLYDAFVFGLDEEADRGDADAFARPSKPYVTMDRGFGHNGYAVISVSRRGAQEFCKWLSARTGRAWRLPTEAEWERACRAGRPPRDGPWGFAGGRARLDEHAWYARNAEHRTHPVGTKRPNDLGLFDVHGNAAEWCRNADGSMAVRGGSWRDGAEAVGADARLEPDPAWNASDPQIPKSTWWLADAGFVGLRIVTEDGPDRLDE